jgi:hypothetical protein
VATVERDSVFLDSPCGLSGSCTARKELRPSVERRSFKFLFVRPIALNAIDDDRYCVRNDEALDGSS